LVVMVVREEKLCLYWNECCFWCHHHKKSILLLPEKTVHWYSEPTPKVAYADLRCHCALM
jgi:hypothetical protein